MLNPYLQDAKEQKGVNRYVENIQYRMTATEFKRWRQIHGWSQAQAAKQLGLSQAAIAQYETVGKIPKTIEAICEKINY
jgi:DNA-binding XRE family transcriptional regulator